MAERISPWLLSAFVSLGELFSFSRLKLWRACLFGQDLQLCADGSQVLTFCPAALQGHIPLRWVFCLLEPNSGWVGLSLEGFFGWALTCGVKSRGWVLSGPAADRRFRPGGVRGNRSH